MKDLKYLMKSKFKKIIMNLKYEDQLINNNNIINICEIYL